MFETLIDFLCGFERLAFESDFGLNESMGRLAVEVKPALLEFQPLASLKNTVVVGKISEQSVSLWCERLFITNAFRPVFRGHFQIVGRRVILNGKLRMSGGVYAVVISGFGIALFFTLATLLELTKNPHDPALWVRPIGGPVLALFVLGMVRIAKWLSAGDERWLLATIRSALSKATATSDPTTQWSRSRG